MNNWIKKTIYYLDSNDSFLGRIIDLALTIVNLLACGLIVFESLYTSDTLWPQWLKLTEYCVVIVFIIEFLFRLITAKSKIKYIFSFYGIIDILSIIPSILTIDGFAFLRALKVLRILRFIRFLENETFFFGKISRIQLQALKTLFTVFTLIFVFSGLILFAEKNSINENVNISSFPNSFYYVVTTLSTVGFGDFITVSPLGRFFTVLMIMLGAVLVPWQAGKLIQMLIHYDSEKIDITCPKCGLIGHDRDASHCKACGSVIFQKYEGDI
jgi:voltage-gated potassium channel